MGPQKLRPKPSSTTMSFTSNQLTITPVRVLGRDESKNDLDVWWAKVKVHLKNSNYKELIVKTWTAQQDSETRGLTQQTINGKSHTPEEARSPGWRHAGDNHKLRARSHFIRCNSQGHITTMGVRLPETPLLMRKNGHGHAEPVRNTG